MYEYQNEGSNKPEKIAIMIVWPIKAIPIDKGWFKKMKIVFNTVIKKIRDTISENSLLKY